ncbi:MAG: DNA double-strand break repair nuclease NurA [Anaerolineaceae bacterium]|nr:DNA double-strand break repair nuclease NurA [Anaerolineaceae bacterium]
MPVNYQEIQGQIRQMGEQEPQRVQRLKELKQQAAGLLETHNTELDLLQAWVKQAAAANHNLRCAVPVAEPLKSHFPPPAVPERVVILAADGSQINPSRHDSVPFGVVNVGAFRMAPGSGQTPEEFVHSELITGDDLYAPNGGAIGEEVVALRRDLRERQMLAELAAQEHQHDPDVLVAALTDGPLEPFVREPLNRPDLSPLYQDYLKALRGIANPQTATAGYVDKPRSDLLVRLLELVTLGQSERLDRAGHERSLPGVTDAGLLAEILQPGDRSALFALQSRTAQTFTDEIAIHFFYLNVGREKSPSLVRVEVPAWAAGHPPLLNMLHAVLIEQCRMLGNRPYPYALHRSHEVAVVRFEEKTHLQTMIEMELRQRGIEFSGPSNKQATKDNSGNRTRFS